MIRLAYFILEIAIILGASAFLSAQPDSEISPPTSASTSDSLEHGLRLLSNVRDNVLSFDDPGFYWFCRYVTTPEGSRALKGATGSSSASESTNNPAHVDGITPLKFLLERPNDYRGRPATIEGTLVAKWSWSVANRDVPSPLHQCEIAVAGTRALAAVVTTESVDHIPIRSSIRATGYFIKVRAFQTTGGESGFGPLLVARSLTPVTELLSGSASPTTGSSKNSQYLILTLTAIAAFVWLALRRGARTTAHGVRPATPTSSTPPGDDDFDWMTRKSD